MTFLPSAMPWRGLLFFPALLVFVAVLLLSTATLAFYVKQTVSLERLRPAFEHGPRVGGNAAGALLGAVTPFCTCTAVPLFIGMLEAGLPLGPAVSFLLSSPTINLGAILVLLVVFGWRVAVVYGSACIAAAIVAGWLLGGVPRDRAVRDFMWLPDDAPVPGPRRLHLRRAGRLGMTLTRRVLPWLALATLAGIAIDALIPTASVASIGRLGVACGVPLAALLGAVIYADILLLIPVGYALIQHGAPAPVVLTFMLAASGLSLPEMVVLGRVLRGPLVVAFVGVTLILYIALGYGFVAVMP